MGDKARKASKGQICPPFRSNLKGSFSTPRAMGRYEGFKQGSGYKLTLQKHLALDGQTRAERRLKTELPVKRPL